MRGSSTPRLLAAIAAVAVVAAVLLLARGGEDASTPAPAASTAAAAATSAAEPPAATSSEPSASAPAATVERASDLPTVRLDELPPEALETWRLIDEGGPYPFRADDGTFRNREGVLPERSNGYYREYTVVTPGEDDRGARRLVVGEGGERYYTDDHYDTFREVIEGMSASVAPAALGAVLGATAPPALRRLPAATAASDALAAARRHGRRPVLVDGLLVGTKATLLEALGDAVGAPGWWGRNWDALADVLGDPALSPAADALVWTWPSALLDAAPATYATALDVLAEAVQRRAEGAEPLVVLLCDARPLPGTAPLAP